MSKTDLIYRLRNPVFGTETSERNLMAAAAERIQQLEGILRGISDFLHTAPAESGVCCCGSPMEGHGYWDGHSPVDMFPHSADRWVTEARAILDAKP